MVFLYCAWEGNTDWGVTLKRTPLVDLPDNICLGRNRAQGLTGLANTLPNAIFRGLRQVLHVDGMVFDAEYEVIDQLADGDPQLLRRVSAYIF